MLPVILQPAGSEDASLHYSETIISPPPLKYFEPFLSEEEYSHLIVHVYEDENEPVPVWGVTRGKKNVNRNQWEGIFVNSICLFAKNKQIFSSAQITKKFHNSELANELWGLDQNGNTWEYIFLLKNVTPQAIDVKDIAECLEYSPSFNVQRFQVLEGSKAEIIYDAFPQIHGSGYEEDWMEGMPFNDDKIENEIERRVKLWNVIEGYNQGFIHSDIIRQLNLYSGQAGIWRDKKTTGHYSKDDIGITVSILHTGDHYPDEIDDQGIIYHYPKTDRLGDYDLNEINATKNCKNFGIPLFVITHSEVSNNKSDRMVRRGWVQDWDDEEEQFLITFSDAKPIDNITIDEKPFTALDNANENRKLTSVKTRPNQAKFRFDCLKRYGSNCAFCNISDNRLLEAAHLIPKDVQGSDDPRNGLILCRNHHAAHDNGLLVINPNNYNIECIEINPKEIKLDYSDISHLNDKPHNKALIWRWEKVYK